MFQGGSVRAPELKEEKLSSEEHREKEARKIKALYTLLWLVFFAIVGLLSLHAMIVGPGSLFWDLTVNSFGILTAAVFVSGVVFPLLGILLVIAFPLILFALYLKSR